MKIHLVIYVINMKPYHLDLKDEQRNTLSHSTVTMKDTLDNVPCYKTKTRIENISSEVERPP